MLAAPSFSIITTMTCGAFESVVDAATDGLAGAGIELLLLVAVVVVGESAAEPSDVVAQLTKSALAPAQPNTVSTAALTRFEPVRGCAGHSVSLRRIALPPP